MVEKNASEDDLIDTDDVPDESIRSLQADAERILMNALESGSELTAAQKQEMERSIDRLSQRSTTRATAFRKIFDAVSKNRQAKDPLRQQPIPAVQMNGIPESFWKRLKGDRDAVSADKNDADTVASFMQTACTGNNLLSLDRTLTRQQLEERIAILDKLAALYEHSNDHVAKVMRDTLIRTCGVPAMSANTGGAIARLEEQTNVSAGAENKNIFYLQDAEHAGVLKITKGRHDRDFYSVLKLMRNMAVVALRLNSTLPDGHSRVETIFQDMTIFLEGGDQAGDQPKLKRIVRQQYAQGTPIKELSEEEKAQPAFQTAWRAFLQTVSGMKKTDGVVLDITDSPAGFTPERGNVAHTENVFVRKEGEGYVFSIIDPDVFDTREGEHKFSPYEYVRSADGTISKIQGAVKGGIVALMNGARKLVTDWQDRYVRKERSSHK
ncbi:hypothetical protein HZA87_06035 [Candidatus Uhrbacteria bacterium]|nr:hypothetical protein [Candidatus Uhrbacteria bacterium]